MNILTEWGRNPRAFLFLFAFAILYCAHGELPDPERCVTGAPGNKSRCCRPTRSAP
jgi:hypothetical protein